MPNLETLRNSVVLSDATANTKIIGEYTGFAHIYANEDCLFHSLQFRGETY